MGPGQPVRSKCLVLVGYHQWQCQDFHFLARHFSIRWFLFAQRNRRTESNLRLPQLHNLQDARLSASSRGLWCDHLCQAVGFHRPLLPLKPKRGGQNAVPLTLLGCATRVPVDICRVDESRPTRYCTDQPSACASAWQVNSHPLGGPERHIAYAARQLRAIDSGVREVGHCPFELDMRRFYRVPSSMAGLVEVAANDRE
jgi:hypothetical protein